MRRLISISIIVFIYITLSIICLAKDTIPVTLAKHKNPEHRSSIFMRSGSDKNPDERNNTDIFNRQLAIDYTIPILISDPESYVSFPPNSTNLIHLYDNSYLIIYSGNGFKSRLSNDNCESWEPENYHYEVPVSVSASAFKDENGIIHIYYLHGPYNINYSYSSDYGTTWELSQTVHTFQKQPNALSFEANQVSDGSVWFSYYYSLEEEIPNAHILQMHPDGSVSNEINLSETTSDTSYPGNICSLINDDLIVVYTIRKDGNSQIAFRISHDDGISWTNPEIQFPDPAHDTNPFIFLDETNVLWLIFNSTRGANPGSNFWYAKSLDNGRNWTDLTQFTDYVGIDRYPSLVATDNRMLIAWASNRFGSNGIWLGDLYETKDENAPPFGYIKSITPQYICDESHIVIAQANDEDGLNSVNLIYSIDGGSEIQVPMYDNGTNGDSLAGDTFYAALIGPFSSQVEIAHQILLSDYDGMNIRFPYHSLFQTIYDIQNSGDLWSVYNNSGLIGDFSQRRPSMEWPGGSNNYYLYQASFMIGGIIEFEPRVSFASEFYSKWRSITPWNTTKYISDKDISVTFTDEWSINSLGVEVHQQSHSWSDESYRDIIIIDYTIFNRGNYSNLNDIYFGLHSDFDISNFPGAPQSRYSDDMADFDLSRNLIYMYDSDDPNTTPDDTGEPDSTGSLQSGGYIGIALLDSDVENMNLSWTDYSFLITNEALTYQYLQAPFDTNATEVSGDYAALISVGPMNISSQDSVHVAVGYAIGAGLDELLKNVDNMKQLYNSIQIDVADDSYYNMPEIFSCAQNYPNPFNAATTIRYQLPYDCHVTIRIYNINGHTVTTLVDEEQRFGNHQITWNAVDKSSGLYFYHLNTRTSDRETFELVKKMILLK